MGDNWIEEVDEVKAEVIRHFEHLFSEPDMSRPILEGIVFSQIFELDNAGLIAPFTIDEIRGVVWS